MVDLMSLENELAPLRRLRDGGQLSYGVYCKQVVRLASGYVDADPQSALDALKALPNDYFRDELVQQMLDDESFGDATYMLAIALVESGLVSQTADLICNMRAGAA